MRVVEIFVGGLFCKLSFPIVWLLFLGEPVGVLTYHFVVISRLYSNVNKVECCSLLCTHAQIELGERVLKWKSRDAPNLL